MQMTDTNFLIKLFHHYNFDIDQYVGYKVILKGHINTTYVLYFDIGHRVKRFIAQEINCKIFNEPEKLMNNIYKVTSYGKDSLKKQNKKNYLNSVLRIYPTRQKKSFFIADDGSYWRIYHYIENSVSYDISTDRKIFYEAGIVIGEFHNMLDGFDANKLYPVIKDFHNTPKRYEKFLSVLNNASDELKETCKEEIAFFKDNVFIANTIQKLIDENKMPLRVTHNDTKLNNLMFQHKTNRGLCLIDLDTVMPGSLCFDFGDFIRSACNKGEEDAKDLSTVIFQKDLCIEFVKGFLEKSKDSITDVELNNLIMGALDMTYECGMRFLTDYLEGNVYFKVKYPEHNLIRCRTQIRMCQQILENKQELESKVLEVYNKLTNQ